MRITGGAVLPDEYDAALGADSSAALFWRLVATDSCEAVHMGALLALRRLMGLHAASATPCDARGAPLADLGLQTAARVAPFARHVKLTPEQLAVDPPDGAGGPPRLRLAGGAAPLPPAPHGGAMHQLVWLRAADGREWVCDFTGPQYGIEERLDATRTPFWCCDLGDGGVALRSRYGFELQGEPVSFLPSVALPTDLLANEVHTHLAVWMRDSILGVMVRERMLPSI
jgi:hypothetical protein